MISRSLSKRLGVSFLIRTFSGPQPGQVPPPQPPRPVDISKISELTGVLGTQLYPESMAVAFVSNDLIKILDQQCPHEKHSHEYMKFMFMQCFNPMIHPQFFKKFESILKEHGCDYNPNEITASLSHGLSSYYENNKIEEVKKTAERYQLFCLYEMIIKAFTGQAFFLELDTLRKYYNLNLHDYMTGQESVQLRLNNFLAGSIEMVSLIKKADKSGEPMANLVNQCMEISHKLYKCDYIQKEVEEAFKGVK